MNWQEEFDKRFGKAGPQKNSDSLNESAGCDDCSWCIEIRDEHKAFISTLIEQIIEDIPDNGEYEIGIYWAEEGFSKHMTVEELKQELRDKYLGKEQE